MTTHYPQPESAKFNRRSYLKATVALTLATALPQIKSLAESGPFAGLDATAQADLVRTKAVSPLELIDAAIERIGLLNQRLNAVVTPSFDAAREIAKRGGIDGPFRGVPYLVKDLLDQKGVRTSSGSKLFANHIANSNASNVQAAFDAGLISLGKSNTPEFGLLPSTESIFLGPARNPWNLNYSTAGSSGGAGAAVASGMVPIASASDGGGSIRVPASSCGVVGLKTSRYRTIDDAGQRERPIDLSVRFVHTRTVRDTVTALSVMQHKDGSNGLPWVPANLSPIRRKLKIGLTTKTNLGKEASPDVKASTELAAKFCEDLGHTIVPVDPMIDGELFVDAFLTIWALGAKGLTQLAAQISNGKSAKETGLLEPWTIGLADWFDARPVDQVENALRILQTDTTKSAAFFEDYDMLLTPVTRTPPPRIGIMAPDVPFETLLERAVDFVGYTPLANVTGEPAISLPLGWSANGLPIGSQFQTGLGKEQDLLELALALEESQPWADRWPRQSL